MESSLILEKLERIEAAVLRREKPFLNIQQAAEYLDLSINTVYGYISRKLLPTYKLNGRRVYFSLDDLNQFILDRKNRSSTKAEIQAEATTEALTGKRRRQ